MSGKSRRGKKRRLDDGLAEYRTYGKDPLYADYCKQVITLMKKGRQKDLQRRAAGELFAGRHHHRHAGVV